MTQENLLYLDILSRQGNIFLYIISVNMCIIINNTMDSKHTSNYHVEDVKTSERMLAMCYLVYECHVLIQTNR
jgi:hypothetical protein